MRNFAEIVNRVINKSDIILEVLDARFIEKTRNSNIEEEIRNKNKILIYVINKCDFMDKEYLDEAKKGLEPCVFVSAKNHLGTRLLKQTINILASKNKLKNPKVGVIGYPNVGKSSVINALKGRGSAKTSPEAGYTRAAQNLRIGNNFLIIDTPGVIPEEETKEEELVLLGAKNPHTIKDPDLAAIQLIKNYPHLIEKKYKVKVKEDEEETIEAIALKLNLKKKGNLPDIERASRIILKDWISGKINEEKH